MSSSRSGRSSADRKEEDRLMRESEVLGEVAHFRVTTYAEMEALHLELAVLEASIERVRKASNESPRSPKIGRGEV